MTIRIEQTNRMQDDAGERFIDKLMAHFGLIWPSKAKELGAGYRTWLEAGVRAAKGYGIDTQQLSARFVNLWFVWGRDFEKQFGFEWANEIVNAEKRTAYVKIHQLSYHTRIELEARENEMRMVA